MATTYLSCVEEWEQLERNYQELEELHRSYSRKVEEVKAMQQKCMNGISCQRKQHRKLTENLKRINATSEEKEKLEEIHKKLENVKEQYREMEDVLPHENGIYLKVVLGSVNVSLLSKKDKYKYKENYEMFKFYVTIISLIGAILLWLIPPFRVTDAAFQFLLVWYYCTLTIREHILKVNGSRIKGWWITHHFIATVCAGILLIWPDGYTYSQFRNQFVIFSCYISVVQLMQYYYQKGCLYRLRALGERQHMDVTVEGFQSWMWRGLMWILPFLIAGYFFQMYNFYVLYHLSNHPRCVEWQVRVVGYLFLILSLGNLWTTAGVIRTKLISQKWMPNLDQVLRNKYRFNSKVHLT